MRAGSILAKKKHVKNVKTAHKIDFVQAYLDPILSDLHKFGLFWKYLGPNFKWSLYFDLIGIYETRCRFDFGEKHCKIAKKIDFVQAYLDLILSDFHKLGLFWTVIKICWSEFQIKSSFYSALDLWDQMQIQFWPNKAKKTSKIAYKINCVRAYIDTIL